MLQYTASLVVLAAAALLQTTSLVFIYQVKPNLVFALLVVFAHFYKSWTKRTFLILIPALILKFSPTLSWMDIIFIASAFFIVALTDYLPWRRIINSIFTVVIGTIIIGISTLNLRILLLELTYNIILVIILFSLINWVYVKAKK